MGHWLLQWRGLPARERMTVLGMLLLLPLASLLLRCIGYGRTRRLVERCSRNAGRHAADAAEIARGHRLAQLAAIAGRRGLVEATCLRQALVVYGLLRRRGLAPQFQLGVRREGNGIEAHAWVELAGEALGQSTPPHQPFALPPA